MHWKNYNHSLQKIAYLKSRIEFPKSKFHPSHNPIPSSPTLIWNGLTFWPGKVHIYPKAEARYRSPLPTNVLCFSSFLSLPLSLSPSLSLHDTHVFHGSALLRREEEGNPQTYRKENAHIVLFIPSLKTPPPEMSRTLIPGMETEEGDVPTR